MSWQDVITFWFGEIEPNGLAKEAVKTRWWKKNPAFDDEVREKFAALHAEVSAGAHADWLDSPRGALAAVIVLDQFSRNMHRGSGDMFASDELARDIACAAIDRGFDESLPACMQAFLYMPLMHSEQLADQDRCVELFAARASDSEGTIKEHFDAMHGYAVKHRAIVARFGRFPHRNALLGRNSSDEETAFLETPGSSF